MTYRGKNGKQYVAVVATDTLVALRAAVRTATGSDPGSDHGSERPVEPSAPDAHISEPRADGEAERPRRGPRELIHLPAEGRIPWPSARLPPAFR